MFHPNSNGREVIENLTIYDLPIGQKVSGNVSAGVRLFFATSPQSIQFERGIIATASSVGAWVPEYFFNTYQISTGGKKMVTVIFPYDASHNKATMQKISGSNYTGGQVIQGNTTDTLIEKTGSGNAIVESASFDGKFLFFRNTSGNLNSYFAKEAKSLTFSGNQYGINSQNNVTVQMKDRLGKIVTSGGEVTFYYPGITSVFVDNQAATTIQSGNGFRTVNITSGTHDIEIVNDGSTPNPSIPGDVNGDRVINIQDYLLLSNSFGKFSGQTGFNPGADFNGDNVVNIQDYQILSSNFGRSN